MDAVRGAALPLRRVIVTKWSQTRSASRRMTTTVYALLSLSIVALGTERVEGTSVSGTVVPSACTAPTIALHRITTQESAAVFAIDGQAGRIAVLEPFSVDLLDSTTGRRLWRSATSDFTQQLGVGVDDVDGRVFVSDAGTTNGKIGTPGGLTMLDERTGKVLGGDNVGELPYVITVDTVTHRVFVVGGRGPTVSVVDARTGHVVAMSPLDPQNYDIIRSLTVDPTGRWVYMSGDARITVLDGVTGDVKMQFASSAPPGEAASTGTPVLDALTGHLFVPAFLSDRHNVVTNVVTMFDLHHGTRLRAVTLPFYASALALDSRTDRVFAGGDNGFAILDGRTGRLLKIVPLKGTVVGLTTDGATGLVFVGSEPQPNTGPAHLSVVSACSGLVLHTMPLGGALTALSIDAHSGHLVLSVDGVVQLVSVAIGSH